MTKTVHIRRRGLTFIELMFAVIILGVGMIIIASVFPVAIGQQRQTLDEGSINSLERAAIRTLESAASVRPPKVAADRWLPETFGPDMPVPVLPDLPAGEIDSFANNPVLWNRISGDLINAGDARYAFVPFYMRMRTGATPGPPPLLDPFDDSVTFFVVTLVSKDAATFDATNPATYDQLKPANVKITYHFKQDGADPDLTVDPEQDTIKVETGTASPIAGSGTSNAVDAAVAGGFIIRAEHVRPPVAGGTPNYNFPQNAVIRLGSQFEDSEMNTPGVRIFRVAPGYELNYRDSHVLVGSTLVSQVANVRAYAVGADPTDTTKKANRAISCRGFSVTIKDPG